MPLTPGTPIDLTAESHPAADAETNAAAIRAALNAEELQTAASEAEMQAGTVTDIRSMTPERVAQTVTNARVVSAIETDPAAVGQAVEIDNQTIHGRTLPARLPIGYMESGASNGLVTFIMDVDGQSSGGPQSNYEAHKAVFDSYGVFPVAALNSNDHNLQGLGDSTLWLPWQTEGLEIANHGKLHRALTSGLSDAELDDEVNVCLDDLLAAGFDVKAFVYPSGTHDTRARKVVAQRHNCGIAVEEDTYNRKPLKTYGLGRVPLGDNVYTPNGIDQTSGTLEQILANCKSTKSWVIFLMHPGYYNIPVAGCSTVDTSDTLTCPSTTLFAAGMEIAGTNIPAGTTVVEVLNATTLTMSEVATGTGTTEVTFNHRDLTLLDGILTYCVAQSIEVVTVSQALARIGNVVEVGDYANYTHLKDPTHGFIYLKQPGAIITNDGKLVNFRKQRDIYLPNAKSFETERDHIRFGVPVPSAIGHAFVGRAYLAASGGSIGPFFGPTTSGSAFMDGLRAGCQNFSMVSSTAAHYCRAQGPMCFLDYDTGGLENNYWARFVLRNLGSFDAASVEKPGKRKLLIGFAGSLPATVDVDDQCGIRIDDAHGSIPGNIIYYSKTGTGTTSVDSGIANSEANLTSQVWTLNLTKTALQIWRGFELVATLITNLPGYTWPVGWIVQLMGPTDAVSMSKKLLLQEVEWGFNCDPWD